MSKNRFPQGWDEERVRRVLEHYESQTEEEAVAEDEDRIDLKEPSRRITRTAPDGGRQPDETDEPESSDRRR